MVKNTPANAEDIREAGLIPGSGRCPEEDMATHSSILAWRIPRREPGGLQSIAWQNQTLLKQLSTHGYTDALLEARKHNYFVIFVLGRYKGLIMSN